MFLSFDYLHGFNFFTDDDSFGLQSDVFSQLNFLPTSKKYKPVAKKKKKKDSSLSLREKGFSSNAVVELNHCVEEDMSERDGIDLVDTTSADTKKLRQLQTNSFDIL